MIKKYSNTQVFKSNPILFGGKYLNGDENIIRAGISGCLKR
jgi:hypothetical protein